MIVLWCNGSTSVSGPACQGSSPCKTTKHIIVLWCNGSTSVSGTACQGSSPCRTTQKDAFQRLFLFLTIITRQTITKQPRVYTLGYIMSHLRCWSIPYISFVVLCVILFTYSPEFVLKCGLTMMSLLVFDVFDD